MTYYILLDDYAIEVEGDECHDDVKQL